MGTAHGAKGIGLKGWDAERERRWEREVPLRSEEGRKCSFFSSIFPLPSSIFIAMSYVLSAMS